MVGHSSLSDAVESGLQLIKAHSIQSCPDFVWYHAIPGGIDWHAFFDKAWCDYNSIQTPDMLAVCSVLDRALVRLKDKHGFLQYPGYRRNFDPEYIERTDPREKREFTLAAFLERFGDASVQATLPRLADTPDPTLRLYELDHGILHLIIPYFCSGSYDQTTNFQTSIRDFLLSKSRDSVNAVIVDLQDNVGGNMWPMLWGLSPLLGPSALGHFVEPAIAGDGALLCRKTPWHINNNALERTALDVNDAANFTLTDKPVAVLASPYTNSSGEAVFLAFRGRPDTESFGGKTKGRSTCNTPFRVGGADRLVLNICTGVSCDRFGLGSGNGVKACDGTCIAPDHEIEMPPNAFISEWRQRTLPEAISWIRTRALHTSKHYCAVPKQSLG